MREGPGRGARGSPAYALLYFLVATILGSFLVLVMLSLSADSARILLEEGTETLVNRALLLLNSFLISFSLVLFTEMIGMARMWLRIFSALVGDRR